MPLQEQAELWMALRDRMKENWSDLTLQEKKAGESSYRSSGASPQPLERRVSRQERSQIGCESSSVLN